MPALGAAAATPRHLEQDRTVPRQRDRNFGLFSLLTAMARLALHDGKRTPPPGERAADGEATACRLCLYLQAAKTAPITTITTKL